MSFPTFLQLDTESIFKKISHLIKYQKYLCIQYSVGTFPCERFSSLILAHLKLNCWRKNVIPLEAIHFWSDSHKNALQ